MSTPDLTKAPLPGGRFHVVQKITPFQNRYVVSRDAAGEPGELVLFAKQKRMAFKESFTLYADEAATTPVLTVTADRRLDVRSQMTVAEAGTGAVVGLLRKRGARSLLRSTWEVEQPGYPLVTVQERSLLVAVLRRVWGLVPYANNVPVPWVFHFDGTADGRTVLSHSRRWGIRDRYVLEVDDPAFDNRLAVALAICLDALQHR